MADSDNPLPIQPDDNSWLSAPTDASGRPVITVTPRSNAQNNMVDPTIGADYGTYDDPLIQSVKDAADKLFGLEGQTRYQTWPERLVRSAITAPGDALAGQIQPNSDQEIGRAMDMASLGGVGPLAEPATAEMTLGSGMTRMPLNGGEMADAPVFYSAVENAVNGAKIDNAPVSQWLGYLKNQPGVKQEELDYTLGELPPDQKMSKQDMQDYVDANKVQLNEVNKGNAPATYNDQGYPSGTFPEGSTTKWQQYQLAGGSNYKEMLMQLPQQSLEKFKTEYQNESGVDLSNYTDQDIQNLYDKTIGTVGSNFRSSHWDEPNILAHVRMNDRTVNEPGYSVVNQQSGNKSPVFDTQEKAQAYQATLPKSLKTNIVPDQTPLKTLHIEEIQSDWHQQGRRRGYQLTPQQKTAFDAIDQKIVDSGDDDIMGDPDIKSAISKAVDKKILTPEEGRTYLQNYRGADAQNPVPNAPFKQTWPDLALKRMIRYAADNGYDALSWSPGEVQAARYDLSKQIRDIEYYPVGGNNSGSLGGETKYVLGITQHNGEGLDLPKKSYTAKELEDVVGKEVAQKIVNGEGVHYRGHDGKTLEGLDLKVGGEGMKAFYDKMLVDKANAIAKKYGGKVEDKTIQKPMKGGGVKFVDKDGNLITEPQPIHFLRLPQSLKDTAQQKGFPLFSSGVMLQPVIGNPFKDKQWLKPVDYNPFTDS